MGRVLFEITPVQATMRHRSGTVSGQATCRVDLIEPAEPAENAFGADFPDSVRNLR